MSKSPAANPVVWPRPTTGYSPKPARSRSQLPLPTWLVSSKTPTTEERRISINSGSSSQINS